MSWIESHQNLKDNPKVMDLATAMKWDKLFSSTQEVLARDLAIAKLHLFWWWCMDYALTGDLRKHVKKPSRLAIAVNLPGNQGQRFLRAMVESGWIDEQPYMRVHDWWDYSRRYIKLRFKDKPERWQEIERLYTPAPTKSSPSANLGSDRNGESIGSAVSRVMDQAAMIQRLRKVLMEKFTASEVDHLVSWGTSHSAWKGDTDYRATRILAHVLYAENRSDIKVSDMIQYILKCVEEPAGHHMKAARSLLRNSSVTAP